MKTHVKELFILPVLVASLGLMPASSVMGQTFTNLHSFTNGTDGAFPLAGLIISGNTLYGSASSGGSANNGTIFKVNTDGSGFTNLYNFTALVSGNNSDGANPESGLILSSNVLYGTTYGGGSSGWGTVFAVNTNGMGFTNLHSFTGGTGGANPYGGVIISGNTLYGTTHAGGSSFNGSIFKVNTDGTGFTNLYSFTAANYNSSSVITNSDGVNPFAGLILLSNRLYGTAYGGGSSGWGTVFVVNTNGTGFTNLHSFFGGTNDGGYPQAGLILWSNTLYGTTIYGGSGNNGSVFKLNADGTGYTNLYGFTGGSGGSYPYGGLIVSSNILYGMTRNGGIGDFGTVFAVNTNGMGFTNLHNFNANNGEGSNPYGGFVLSGNTLYGTTYQGGVSSEYGTVFSLALASVTVSAPQLTIIPSGANVILTWPSSATGFSLQSTTNLLSPAAWSTNLPSPVVVNGQNTVTNPLSGTQQFYRLLHP